MRPFSRSRWFLCIASQHGRPESLSHGLLVLPFSLCFLFILLMGRGDFYPTFVCVCMHVNSCGAVYILTVFHAGFHQLMLLFPEAGSPVELGAVSAS